MILLVDIGNTRFKWAQLLQGELCAGVASEYDHADISLTLSDAWKNISIPQRIIVANVAGTVIGKKLSDWVSRNWGIEVEFLVASAQGYGVTNAYTEPAQLGADRWTALLAAWNEMGGPACIIDCGSAITVDVLSDTGQHTGGLILPGFRMMQASLASNTAQISSPATRAWDGVLALGRSTQEAVECGTAFAVLGMLEKLHGKLQKEMGHSVTTIVTGGDGKAIAQALAINVRYESDLVLRGLSVVAKST